MKPLQWLLIVAAAAALALAGCAGGEDGAPGAAGPPGKDGAGAAFSEAIETCGACHTGAISTDATTGVHQANPLPKFWFPTIAAVTRVSGTPETLKVTVYVQDDNGNPVTDLVASDRGIRLTLVQLMPSVSGDASYWENYTGSSTHASGQYSNDAGGTFTDESVSIAPGYYSWVFGNYTDAATRGPLDWSAFNTSTNTWRIGMQAGVSGLADSGDNDWLDFVPADMTTVDAAWGPDPIGSMVPAPTALPAVSVTRNVANTDACNDCHDADGDNNGLAIHGGDRRNVEMCVTCHNYTFSNDRDFKLMVHKIHMGKELPSVQAGATSVVGVSGLDKGGFPQPITNCAKCHNNNNNHGWNVGNTVVDAGNWATKPTMEACGSCHELTNFATGGTLGQADYHAGGPQADNSNCASCHGPGGTNPAAVISNAHREAQIASEAASWSYTLNLVSYNYYKNQLTVRFSVAGPAGTDSDLTTTPWTQGSNSRLHISVGWKGVGSADYTNDGAGQSAPGSPLDVPIVDAFATPASYTDTGGFVYETVIDLPSEAQAAGTGIVFIDGHPAVDVVAGDGSFGYDRIPVANVYQEFAINDAVTDARRQVVDVTKCASCHETLSLHGSNRTVSAAINVTVCTTCHNSANTDLPYRYKAPAQYQAGEEPIDFKRMIHRIHAGRDTAAGGFTVIGYNGSVNNFGGEMPVGTPLKACTICHTAGTEATPLPRGIEGSTVDSVTLADQSDDLNMSPNRAFCSACHDGDSPLGHMEAFGARASVLQENILYW